MSNSAAGPLRLMTVTGSVRTGRFGPAVARWFEGHARDRGHLVVPVDLADVDLPLDGTSSPSLLAFEREVVAADAVVVITPEYNHSYPGPLKIAIDALRDPWADRPIGFVSYGGASGGLRAVEALRLVFEELAAVPVRDCVSFTHVWPRFDESGRHDDPHSARAADRLLDALARRSAMVHAMHALAHEPVDEFEARAARLAHVPATA